MKSTKKSLLMSVLSLVLCFAMLLGTTYAWFTDSVTSGVNKIQAGNLDIDVLHTSASVATATSISAQTNLFRDVNGNEMKWEPGAVSYETFTVKNLGSLALKYNLALNITDYNAVSGTNQTLKDVLKVKVLTGNNMLDTVTRDSVATLGWDTTDTLDVFKKDGGNLYPAGGSNASEETFQVIVYWQPSDNDNNWNVNNGKTTTDGQPLFIEFGVNVVATQLQHENDSFGKDYDENVMIPNLPASVNKVFKSAPISGTSYTATESVKVVNKNSNDAQVAEVPADAVNAIVVAAAAAATDIDSTQDVSTVLQLSIETVDVSAGTASYNIDLTAVMTYTDTNGEAKQVTLNAAQVDAALGNSNSIVEATVNIGTGLTDVTVKHNSTAMTALTSASVNAVGYYYNATNGVLTIKTSSFSPFTVEYKVVERVASVVAENGAESNFPSLTAAMEAAQNGDTVKLWKDSDITYTTIDKKLTLDLNGYTLTATSTNNYALHIRCEFAITDSSANPGKIVERANYGIYADDANANLSISNITVESSGSFAFIAQSGAKINFTSGVCNKGFYNYNSTLNITGGQFSVMVPCAQEYYLTKTDGFYEVVKVAGYLKDSAAAAYAREDTAEKIIEIATAEQLGLLNKELLTNKNFNGYTFVFTADIDAQGLFWKTVFRNGDMNFNNVVFDGKGHTIKNFNVHQKGMFTAMGNNTTFKDITFDGATNSVGGIGNGDGAAQFRAIIASQYVGKVTFENVVVKNSVVAGFWGNGVFIGNIGNDAPNDTAVFRDCSIVNCAVGGLDYYIGGFAGLNGNNGITFEGSNTIDSLILAYEDYMINHYYGYVYGKLNAADNVTVTNCSAIKNS